MVLCGFLCCRRISIASNIHLLTSRRSDSNPSLSVACRFLCLSRSLSSPNLVICSPQITANSSRELSSRTCVLRLSHGFVASSSTGSSAHTQKCSITSQSENGLKKESCMLRHHPHALSSSDGSLSLPKRGSASERRRNIAKNEIFPAESERISTSSFPDECSTVVSHSRRTSFLQKQKISGKKIEAFGHGMNTVLKKDVPANDVDSLGQKTSFLLETKEVSPNNAEFPSCKVTELSNSDAQSFEKDNNNGDTVEIGLRGNNTEESFEKGLCSSDDGEYVGQQDKLEDTADQLKKRGLPPLVVSDILDAIPISKRTKPNFEQLVSLVSFLQTMDMDIEKIPVLIRSAPFMYQRDPILHLEPKIVYLETLGIARKDMCRLILKYPYSLYRPMKVIQAQIEFLRSLSLDDEQLQKIIKKSPLAFRLDAETHLQPRLEFLKSLGLFPNDVKKAVLNNSRILSMTTDKLKKTADYLQGLGFQVGTEELSKVILRCGSVTCETLQEGLKNLSMVGLSQQEVETLLIRLPIVLSRKRTDTNNKFKYLVEEMNRMPNEILSCPVFLMLSLDKRIKPRYQALSRWRKEKQVTREYSLSYIFLPSDKVLSSRFPGINLKSGG